MRGRALAWKAPGIVALAVLAAGCRVLGTATLITVGAVGLAGYVVYKTGETVVTGVSAVGAGIGAAGAAVGNALTPDPEPVATIVLAGNEIRSSYHAGLDRTWAAADRTFRKSGFQDIAGTKSADAGTLTARAWEGADIQLAMRSLDAGTTDVGIRIGREGNLRTSETVHQWIRSELALDAAP